MLINRITGMTRNLGAPQGWEKSKHGNCVSLPIKDEVLAGGVPAMLSSWQPTPEEIARIVAGAPIRLRVIGTDHPPVMLEVGMAPTVEAE